MNQRSVLLTIGAAVAVAVQAWSACANGASADDSVTDAYNWAVLFLMAMPYAVAGSIAVWVFYAYRRAGEKRGRRKNKSLPGPR